MQNAESGNNVDRIPVAAVPPRRAMASAGCENKPDSMVNNVDRG